MGRSKEQAIADSIMRRVMDNRRKRTRTHVREAYEDYFSMSKSPSSTTSGMNVSNSNVVIARRPAPLETPQEQQAHAEPRLGTIGRQNTLVSPAKEAPAAVTGLSSGVSTDASDGGSVAVKQTDYKVIAGAYGAGSDFRGTKGDVAKDSLNQAADNGGPRNAVGQFRSTSKLDTPKPFENSTAGTEGDRA